MITQAYHLISLKAVPIQAWSNEDGAENASDLPENLDEIIYGKFLIYACLH
jgi:hypothetical protein